jgi:phosphoserine phosphatase RsbU/P
MTEWMQRLSPRAIRLLYSLFALAVLAVSGYNLFHILIWRVPSNDQCEWRQSWSDTSAVHVDWRSQDGALSRMGFERGDIIHAINGQTVRSATSARRLLLSAAHEDTLHVLLERDLRIDNLALVVDTAIRNTLFFFERSPETLVITNIVPRGVTDRAGAMDGDILLRIDGISVRNMYGAQYLLNRHSAGSIAEFTVERDGEMLLLHVEVLKTFNYPYLGMFVLGLGFFIVGYIVVMLRPEGRIQRKFGRYGILALYLFGMQYIAVNPMGDSAWYMYSMISLAYLARIAAPPALVTFFFHFPVRKSVAGKRSVIALLYLPCVLAAGLLLGNTLRILPFMPDRWLLLTAQLLPVSYFFIGMTVFAHSYFSIHEATKRRPLRPILHSSIIGIAVFIYLSIISTTYPLVIFLQPYLLLPALLFIGIPPAFGYAIFRHRLMDVTVIVKRSILYGLITAAIAAIYIVFVFGLGSLLGVVLGKADNSILILIAFIVIALLFDPIKRRMQEWVDRIFYRERYNYQKALLEFSRELPRQIKLEEILTSMVSRISLTMHVERVAVSLCDDAHGCHMVGKNIEERCCDFGHVDGGLLHALKETRGPLSVALIDEDLRIVDADDRRRIREAGIVLVVPMFLKDRLIGAINVGEKMSGNVYSQEDIDLLSTVAGQAAIAIENARLHASELEKQKITEQLRLAQRIQQGLLPHGNPGHDRLDIAAVSLPAMTVGGDYYDFIPLPDDRLLIVVGDVSGKGISAALYMAKVQGILRFAAQVYSSPRDILVSTNRHLYQGMERNSFITLILAMYDPRNGTVTICRGGHTYPIIGENGDARYLEMSGIGLGLESGKVFDESLREHMLQLQPGSMLLLYSDGLTESMNADMEQFGEQRLLDVIRRSPQHTAGELRNAILTEVQNHRGASEQNDDITLVVIRNKPLS